MIWPNDALAEAWIEAFVHGELEIGSAALDQAIDVEIQRINRNVTTGNDGGGWCINSILELGLGHPCSASVAGFRFILNIRLNSCEVLILSRIFAGMEPGVAIQGKVASGIDIDRITSHLAVDNNAVLGVVQRHSAAGVDHPPVDVKIGGHRIALVVKLEVCIGILINHDLAGGGIGDGAGRVIDGFVVAINLARIKDGIGVINSFGDPAVIDHHVGSHHHNRQGISYADIGGGKSLQIAGLLHWHRA